VNSWWKLAVRIARLNPPLTAHQADREFEKILISVIRHSDIA
jgi:hypothetical protein